VCVCVELCTLTVGVSCVCLPQHPDYKLQRSSVGHKTKREEREYSDVRTSENAFDTSSPTAVKVIRRAFDMLRMEYVQGESDGLQVVKYDGTSAQCMCVLYLCV